MYCKIFTQSITQTYPFFSYQKNKLIKKTHFGNNTVYFDKYEIIDVAFLCNKLVQQIIFVTFAANYSQNKWKKNQRFTILPKP